MATLHTGTECAAKWFACRSRSQHEYLLERQVINRGIPAEVFLPRYTVSRQWHDRKKVMQPLLFPGYVFVSALRESLVGIARCVGFAGWISFQGQPAMIPDSEMAVLKTALDFNPRPVSRFTSGEWVMVKEGPLSGTSGQIDRCKGTRLVLRVRDCLYSVEVNDEICEPLTDYQKEWQRP